MTTESNHLKHAVEAYRAGKYRKTLAIARQALGKDCDNAELKKLAADAYHALGEASQAKELYAELLALDASDPDHQFGYANACYASGSVEEAKQRFEAFLAAGHECAPEARHYQTMLLAARALLAHTYLKLGSDEAARTLVAETLKLFEPRLLPEQGGLILGVKALLDVKDKKTDAARKTLQQAILLAPENIVLLAQLRQLNEPCSRQSRLFLLSIQGSANQLALYSGAQVAYAGGGAVLADSAEEALGYLAELSPYADPGSLRIKRCTRRKNEGHQRKGVLCIMRSCSFETLSQRPPQGSFMTGQQQ